MVCRLVCLEDEGGDAEEAGEAGARERGDLAGTGRHDGRRAGAGARRGGGGGRRGPGDGADRVRRRGHDGDRAVVVHRRLRARDGARGRGRAVQKNVLC